jgi:hypothetical protein
MQFVITAYDGEGMLDKRMEVRPLHLEGMERLKKHLIAAGGLLDDEGKLKNNKTTKWQTLSYYLK